MSVIGKSLIIFGIILIVVGALMVFGAKLPWFGKLPGDIYVQNKTFSFYFPVTTCILLSALLTLIFFLIGRR